MPDRAPEITQLLAAAASGDDRAAQNLLPLVYEELHSLARARMARAAPGNTLQATALVHEAYLRLVGGSDPGWNGRGHFFGAAALAMRHILIEQARRKAAVKHGAGFNRVELAAVDLAGDASADEVLALDEALKRLEQTDPAAAQVVMLRHFAGLPDGDTAAALGISERTVRREWRFAKAWLQRELGGPADSERRDELG